MSNCQKCGARADPEDEFCPDCGARISAQSTGVPPLRGVMVVQPKKHRFLSAVVIIIVLIFLLRACASFSSPPQVYRPTQEVIPPLPSERLISIETPPPRVNPIPEPLRAGDVPLEKSLDVRVNAPETIISGEDYGVTVLLKNNLNVVLPELDIFVSSELFEERRVLILTPWQERTENFEFLIPDTTRFGTYTANIRVYYDKQLISRQEVPFTVSAI